jgi:hypothetical protein
MNSIALDNLSLGNGTIDVRVEYHYTPGDIITLCQQCGYEPRGAAATAELLDVEVTAWHLNDKTYQRDKHWIWYLLDAFAMDSIERNWDLFEHHLLDPQRN